MKNCKGTLTPKMPFAARFSCCATIDFNSTLIYFPRGYDNKFITKSLEFVEILKLAEKCSAALKSVMFVNDFDNFNKKCRG